MRTDGGAVFLLVDMVGFVVKVVGFVHGSTVNSDQFLPALFEA